MGGPLWTTGVTNVGGPLQTTWCVDVGGLFKNTKGTEVGDSLQTANDDHTLGNCANWKRSDAIICPLRHRNRLGDNVDGWLGGAGVPGLGFAGVLSGLKLVVDELLRGLASLGAM